MIFHPHIGRRVRIHYAKRAAGVMPYHGKTGVVRIVSRGPGPRNVGVEVDGRLVVVPRGNLVAIGTRPTVGPKSTPGAGAPGAEEAGT